MYEALRKTDARTADIETFLASLHVEHNIAGMLAQLKALWLRRVKALIKKKFRTSPLLGPVDLVLRSEWSSLCQGHNSTPKPA